MRPQGIKRFAGMYRGTFRRGKAPCQRLKCAGTMAGSCLRHCRRQLPFRTPLGRKTEAAPEGLLRSYPSLRERDFSSRTRRDEKMKNDLAGFRRRRRRKEGRGFGPFLALARDGGTGDEGPRSAACFYWKCLLSAWPRSGFGGGGAAAAAGRGKAGSWGSARKKTGILRSLKPCPIDEIVGAWYAI